MLSKNNKNEAMRRQEPAHQRFTLKKFSVGVASVLIGFTFLGVQSVSANVPGETTNSQPVTNVASGAKDTSTTQPASQQSQNNKNLQNANTQPSNFTDDHNQNASQSSSSTNTLTINPGNLSDHGMSPSQIGVSMIESPAAIESQWGHVAVSGGVMLNHINFSDPSFNTATELVLPTTQDAYRWGWLTAPNQHLYLPDNESYFIDNLDQLASHPNITKLVVPLPDATEDHNDGLWVKSDYDSMEVIFNNTGFNNSHITEYDLAGLNTTGITSMKGLFDGFNNVTTIKFSTDGGQTEFNTSAVTDMSQMFASDPSLTTLTGLNTFDTGNVSTMEQMFGSGYSYTSMDPTQRNKIQNLDLSSWDTHNVQNMNYMFNGMSIDSVINLSGWNFHNLNPYDILLNNDVANQYQPTFGNIVNSGITFIINNETNDASVDGLVRNSSAVQPFDGRRIVVITDNARLRNSLNTNLGANGYALNKFQTDIENNFYSDDGRDTDSAVLNNIAFSNFQELRDYIQSQINKYIAIPSNSGSPAGIVYNYKLSDHGPNMSGVLAPLATPQLSLADVPITIADNDINNGRKLVDILNDIYYYTGILQGSITDGILDPNSTEWKVHALHGINVVNHAIDANGRPLSGVADQDHTIWIVQATAPHSTTGVPLNTTEYFEIQPTYNSRGTQTGWQVVNPTTTYYTDDANHAFTVPVNVQVTPLTIAGYSTYDGKLASGATNLPFTLPGFSFSGADSHDRTINLVYLPTSQSTVNLGFAGSVSSNPYANMDVWQGNIYPYMRVGTSGQSNLGAYTDDTLSSQPGYYSAMPNGELSYTINPTAPDKLVAPATLNFGMEESGATPAYYLGGFEPTIDITDPENEIHYQIDHSKEINLVERFLNHDQPISTGDRYQILNATSHPDKPITFDIVQMHRTNDTSATPTAYYGVLRPVTSSTGTVTYELYQVPNTTGTGTHSAINTDSSAELMPAPVDGGHSRTAQISGYAQVPDSSALPGYDHTTRSFPVVPVWLQNGINGSMLRTNTNSLPTHILYEYERALRVEPFSQSIVYQLPDGTVIKTVSGSQGLNGDLYNGIGVVWANDVNSLIDANMPTGYDYVSGKIDPTATIPYEVIHVHNPAPFMVIVKKSNPTEQTFSQNIIYQTADGHVISDVPNAITGTLTSGSATVSVADVNAAIDSNMPTGYSYVSGKLTAAETITSTTPAALTVIVRANSVGPTVEAFSQNIIYQTADGHVISDVPNAITGTLTSGSATVSAANVNAVIDSNMPNGYSYVSGKLSAAESITSTTPAALRVIVKANASRPEQIFNQGITYETADGQIVKEVPNAINGTLTGGLATVSAADANSAIDFFMPNGYNYVSGKLSAAETITSTTPAPVVVIVAAQNVTPINPNDHGNHGQQPTNPTQPTNPNTNPTNPTTPVTPVKPNQPSKANGHRGNIPAWRNTGTHGAGYYDSKGHYYGTVLSSQKGGQSVGQVSSKQTLPQTGNAHNNSAAIAGLGLAGITAMLGMTPHKKRN